MLTLIFALLLAYPSPREAEMPIRAQVERGPVFVNQPVPLRVSVVTDGERPVITPPKLPGARLLLVEESVRPVSTSAIGDIISETNQYLTDFLLVPAQSGPLNVPPFLAEQGDRIARTKPIPIVAQPWPPDRPAAFLGGVGRLRVETRVQPASIRLGETLGYEIHLEGPGAIGSDQSPISLERIKSLPIQPTIEALPSELFLADPPLRIFRYRIRPARPGEAILPVVPVAWLDPRTQRYQTVTGSTVSVRIVDVPRFDPERVTYAPLRTESRPRSWPWVWMVSCAGLLVGAISIAYRLAARRRLRARRLDRVARAWARRFSMRSHSLEQTALLIQEALISYLEVAEHRPGGTLTPTEARDAILRVTGHAELAELATSLVSRADQVRFAVLASSLSEGARDQLNARARAFFEALAGVRVISWKD